MSGEAALQAIQQRLREITPQARHELESRATRQRTRAPFVPNPGPQTDAYFCPADVLLYGGSPGGGKTGLEIGLGLNEHFRTLIVRKAFTDLQGILDTAKKLVGTEAGFVGGSRPRYTKPDGGVIHFIGAPKEGIAGQQGNDHDLVCVDEAAQLTEQQVRMLLGWVRSDRPGQRCRAVLGSNPPLDSVGDWLIDFFGPWLNDNHPNPAKPGELRYFLPTANGPDVECEQGDTCVIEGIEIHAQSRTYIPSQFTDNPYYTKEEYSKQLGQLPAEVRARLVSGNFMLARTDQPFQVIPTAWVRAAQARWTPKPPDGIPMCAIGLDVGGGGTDEVVAAPRYDGWYAPLVKHPGSEVPDGRAAAAIIVTVRRHQADVMIDLGGGYGGEAYSTLKENIGAEHVHGHKGAEKSVKRTKDQKRGFTNKRSALYWAFREALDPDQEGGSPIALPDDPKLVADLTILTFITTPRGIAVMTKEDACKALGRSTDAGDAVVMSWACGPTYLTHGRLWRTDQRAVRAAGGRTPNVDLGQRYAARRRR